MDRQIYELSREAHRDDCRREAYKQYYQALEAKIAWMEQEASAASATIEQLREALRPFVCKCEDDWCENLRFNDDKTKCEHYIARAALEEKE